MNIERRIKKHIHGKTHKLRFPCPKGLETATQMDARLLLQDWAEEDGAQIALDTGEGHVSATNVPYMAIQYLLPRLRSAKDIFLFIGKKRCLSEADLSQWLNQIPWALYLGNQTRLRIASFKSKIYHEGLIRNVLTNTLAAANCSISDDENAPLLNLELRRDEAILELGLAGRPLYQRDYKERHVSIAPLKAHTAFNCIATYYGWVAQSPATEVTIPFAGSGTLGFESCLYTLGLYPGLWRNQYALQQLPFFKEKTWEHYRVTAPHTQNKMHLHFIERDPEQAEALKENCEKFCSVLEGSVTTTVETDDALQTSDPKGPVFMNPPYGQRLAASDLFFNQLSQWICSHAQSGFCLVPSATHIDLGSNKNTTTVEFRSGGSYAHAVMWASKKSSG